MDKKIPRKNNESYKNLIVYVEDRLGHDFRYALNTKKIKEQIGWSPCTKFEKGIELTVNWYIDNKWWWKNKIMEKK